MASEVIKLSSNVADNDNPAYALYDDGTVLESHNTYEWRRVPDDYASKLKSEIFNMPTTRASRNAGGGKQSRPALRKARGVVGNK